MPESRSVARRLERTPAEDGWHDAGLTLDMALDDFLTAKTPQQAAYALVKVNDARSDLRTWLPGWDYETGTLPWEREVD